MNLKREAQKIEEELDRLAREQAAKGTPILSDETAAKRDQVIEKAEALTVAALLIGQTGKGGSNG